MHTVDVIIKHVFKNRNGSAKGQKGILTLKVEVAGLELYAYTRDNMQYEEGMMLHVVRFSLTNCWTDFSTAAIILEKFNVIAPEEYEPSRYLNVYVEGTVNRRGSRTLREVGKNKKLFYSRTMKIDNNRGKTFNLLMCGFNNLAEELYLLEDLTKVAISGTLCKSKRAAGYEVHIWSITKLEESRAVVVH